MTGATEDLLLFVGTQCSAPGEGIFAVRFDTAMGRLSSLGLAAEVDRPTWLLRDPAKAVIYAVSEVGNAGDREGAVLSFSFDGRCGKLHLLSQSGSGGGGATHLALAPDVSALFVANFGGGQAAVLPLTSDGTIKPLASIQASTGTGPHRRQQSPHPHGVTLAPSGRFLLVPDMGADRVFLYLYDPLAKSLIKYDPWFVETPPGSGPRLLLFGSTGAYAYLLSELSAEIYVFSWHDRSGSLEQIQRVALDAPEQEGARSAAAITLSACGRFLYASNRSMNEILLFEIDSSTGLLTETQRVASGGEKPWDVQISPDGQWMLVANQGSDSISVLRMAADGRLAPFGDPLAVPTPTSLCFAGALC